MPSIEQYKMLIGIAEHKSLRIAAHHMHKTQPTLTNAIKKMESELGVKLLDRSGYRIKLTDEGKRIKELAIQLVDKNSQINELATRLSSGEEAFIRIAVEASFDLTSLLPVLHMLQTEHQSCQIMLQQEYLSGSFEKLINQQADLAITPLENSLFPIGEIEFKPVTVGEFVNLASPSLVSKYGQLSHVEQLRNEYQIVVKDSGTMTNNINIGVQTGQRVWYVNNFESKKILIENGLGWGTLPKKLVTEQLKSKQLIELSLDGFPMIDSINYQLVKMKNKVLGPIAEKIWRML